MKKIILFLSLFIFIYPFNTLNAGIVGDVIDEVTGNGNNEQLTEEERCFHYLNKAISNDSRFVNNSDESKKIFPSTNGKRGLLKVLYNEANNSYLDLSDYNTFTDYLVQNPNPHTDLYEDGITKYDFLARRNNIATVVTSGNYVISNIVGFGRDSNFDFPLTAKSGQPFGDKYELNGNFFKEFVLYTHHSITGDFLSCGIVKITPLDGRSFSNISESGYMSNVLNGVQEQSALNNQKCSSGFEGSYINDSSQGYDFYSMKSNVCVENYAGEDYLKMDVLSVAYDNNSDYFNEYVVFPMQVKAMQDAGTEPTGGLFGIRESFLEKLKNNTCLSLLHESVNDLPESCNGSYSDEVVYNKSKFSLLSLFFNTANASRDINVSKEMIEESKGMVVFDNFPYSAYEKIKNINDETLKGYLLLSLTSNLEDVIKSRKSQGIVVTPYEDIFLNCGISYKDINNIVLDFVQNIKDPENIDLNNLTYSNPKFGDCIIPYPDKTHIDKVIEGSFPSNQMIAKKINGEYISPEVDSYIIEAVNKKRELSVKYEEDLNNLTLDFNEGRIDSDTLKLKTEELKINYNNNISVIDEELNKKIEERSSNISDKDINNIVKEEVNKLDNSGFVDSDNFKSNLVLNIFIAILFLIGVLFLIVSFRRKK